MIRDSFRCRYCGQRIVPRRILVALSTLYADELPYYLHYKRGTVHPAYWFVAAEVDHADPGSRGGSWLDVQNLVTACACCNMRKRNHRIQELGWTLEPVVEDDWDGLTGVYPALCTAAGCADWKYHIQYIRALARP